MDAASARRVKERLGDFEPDSDVAGSPRFERFEVVRRLGLGGMGVVFEAMQTSPRRRVAVKVVRADCFSERARRRFEVEVEALARLRHRGIAQIYEAGMADGEYGPQPYFAMELVEGATIIEFAERRGLSVRERLELFAEVCDAVEHAHQRGVVHRDLKPSNIVVDETGERPCAKVLDFGIARATDSDVRSTTVHTDVGQIMGTLAYMSPEQAGGDPDAIDTRSDVYSLGVVLYELLTGRVPIEVSRSNVAGGVRAIQEEPPRPLSAADRHLRGDLETIVGKALAKEKDRRYAGAAALGADVRRYLNDEPIEARPPSAVYQVRKFARRNRGLVGVVVVAVLGLAAAGVVGVVFGVAEARARGEAEGAKAVAEEAEGKAKAELARAETLVAFVKKMLQGMDPDYAMGMDTTLMRKIMDEASKEIGGAGLEPAAEADIRIMLGTLYTGLSALEEACQQLDAAVALVENEPGSVDLLVRALGELGIARIQLGDFEGARPPLDRAVEVGTRELGEQSDAVLDAMSYLGNLESATGNYDNAHELSDRVYRIRVGLLGRDDPDTLVSMQNLAIDLRNMGHAEEAMELTLEAYEARKRLFGADHPATINSEFDLGYSLLRLGQIEQGIEMLEDVFERSKRILGDEPEGTRITARTLAQAYGDVGRHKEAEDMLKWTIDTDTRVVGANHRATIGAKSSLAGVYFADRRFEDAHTLYEEVCKWLEAEDASPGVALAICMTNLGWASYKLGDYARAEQEFGRSVEIFRAVAPDRLPLSTLRGLGESSVEIERFDEGIRVLEELFPVMVERKDRFAREVAGYLGDAYEAVGELEKAAEWRATLKELPRVRAPSPTETQAE